MVKIRYIGKKSEKIDNVANTGIVWDGYGDVKTVPEKAVKKLIEYKDIWELVSGNASEYESEPAEPIKEVEIDDLAPLVNLDGMRKNELQAYAQRNFGHVFDDSIKKDDMKNTIIGLMNRG